MLIRFLKLNNDIKGLLKTNNKNKNKHIYYIKGKAIINRKIPTIISQLLNKFLCINKNNKKSNYLFFEKIKSKKNHSRA